MKLGNFIDYFRRFCILPCRKPSNTYYLLLETFPHSIPSHPWDFHLHSCQGSQFGRSNNPTHRWNWTPPPFLLVLVKPGKSNLPLASENLQLERDPLPPQIPRRKETQKKTTPELRKKQWHPQKNIQKNKGKTMKSKENPRLPLEHSVPGCQKHLWPLERHFAHQTKHPWGSWWGASVRANISPTVQRWPPHTFESQRLTLIHGSSSIIYPIPNSLKHSTYITSKTPVRFESRKKKHVVSWCLTSCWSAYELHSRSEIVPKLSILRETRKFQRTHLQALRTSQ